MNLNQYQELASRTLPEETKQHFFVRAETLNSVGKASRNTDLLHAALGLTSEVGELADPIKKAMFYGKPLDTENIREEAGDLLWYIAGPLCRALGCTLEDLAAANVAKLRLRYPERYSDAAAVARADKANNSA